MNGKEDIIKRLDIIRSEMMLRSVEAKDRAHETMSQTGYLRMWYHIKEIEESLTTISWALMREIDPHS